MARSATTGELNKAAQRLGVASSGLRQHGWKTAPEARLQAVENDPPEWSIEAEEHRSRQLAKRRVVHQRNDTARRLGIPVRALKERGVEPGEVRWLLAAPPEVPKRRQTQLDRDKPDAARRAVKKARQEDRRRLPRGVQGQRRHRRLGCGCAALGWHPHHHQPGRH